LEPITLNTSAIQAHGAHKVEVRASWNDAWDEVPFLYYETMSFKCAPEISTAVLSHEFGRLHRPGDAAFTETAPLDLLNYFVRITQETVDGTGADRSIVWHGVVVRESPRNVLGSLTPAGAAASIPHGSQTFECFGLEWFLTRQRVTTSLVADGDAPQKFRTIGRALPFNSADERGSHARFAPNRYRLGSDPLVADVEGEFFVFPRSTRPEYVQPWRISEVLRYLFAHVPLFGNPAIGTAEYAKLALSPTMTALDVRPAPILAPHGLTLFEIVSRLVNPRRLATWFLSVSGQQIVIDVTTFAEAAVPLAEGGQWPANDNLRTWDMDGNPAILQSVVGNDFSQKYFRVQVIGARQGAVFSMHRQLENFDGDWTDAEQTAYNAGKTTAETIAEKQEDTDNFRKSELLRRVYRNFRIPMEWDGKVAQYRPPPEADPHGAPNPTVPRIGTDGAVDLNQQQGFWLPGLRLEKQLPLLSDHDYSGSALDTPGGPLFNGPDDSAPTFLKPFVLFRYDDGDESPTGLNRWQHIEDAAASVMIEKKGAGSGREWSASSQMRDDVAGFELKFHGAFPHLFATEEFTEIDTWDKSTRPEYDWYKDLIATVYALSDFHVVIEETATNLDLLVANLPGDVRSTAPLIIQMPDARVDYVAPGTIVGLENNELVLSDGGFVRDDRQRMKTTAKIAVDWFKRQRQSLAAAVKGFHAEFFRGHLIAELNRGTITINALITSVRYDRENAVTSIDCQFANLDSKMI